MKKKITTLLIIALLSFSSSVQGRDDLQDTAKNTDKLWRSGSGAHDGSYTAISASMIGWGIGLAVGIAVLAAVLHQSTSSSHHHHAHCH
jgi:hypothetical protein